MSSLEEVNVELEVKFKNCNAHKQLKDNSLFVDSNLLVFLFSAKL